MDNPVSAAEIPVLELIHGDGAVTKIEYLDEVQTTDLFERDRLIGVYGAVVVQDVYPGANPSVLTESEYAEKPKAKKKTSRKPAPKPEPETVTEPAETADNEEVSNTE
jgi:hypothetical protein